MSSSDLCYLENKTLDDIKKLDAELAANDQTFDYYCWDLYAKVGQEYQKDEELKAKRAEVLHLVEAGDNPTAELADYVATRNVECILQTMERFGYSLRFAAARIGNSAPALLEKGV